jgi:hypothetical protein
VITSVCCMLGACVLHMPLVPGAVWCGSGADSTFFVLVVDPPASLVYLTCIAECDFDKITTCGAWLAQSPQSHNGGGLYDSVPW